MASMWNVTISVLMLLSIYGVLAQDSPEHLLAQNAINNLLREFPKSSNDVVVGDSFYLTQQDFVPFLAYITTHSKSFVNQLIGQCFQDVNGTCQSRPVECPGVKEVYELFANVDGHLYADDLVNALPLALNSITSINCTHNVHDRLLYKREVRRPTAAQAWGYGIAFVSTVAVISNIGVFLGTCMEKRFFKRLLQFLVAMGAGSLASTGLLVLIPESFNIMSVEELGEAYVWKSTVAIVSIYVFFTSERVLKTILTRKRMSKAAKFQCKSVVPQRLYNACFLFQKCKADYSFDVEPSSEPMAAVQENNFTNKHGQGHSHEPIGAEEQASRTTLAYMVMAGDIIHNFVDGLSIGAAFSESITVGISVSLAVICEELPHELADIAILLHSGLSLKKSVLINFLSACVCYIGLIIGVLLGMNIDEASKWIFAIAGGLFLYVPLVDMLPDMSSHLDQLLIGGRREAKIVAFLHGLGLTIGAAIIVFIVKISAYIVVD